MDAFKLAHRDDPETSRTAAINLSGTATESVMHAVVGILAQRGPMTPAELERHYFQHQATQGWPQVAFYSIHRRVSQMKKQVGILRAVGRRDGAEVLDLVDDAQQAWLDITDYMTKDKS
jgi:hypothetical protein